MKNLAALLTIYLLTSLVVFASAEISKAKLFPLAVSFILLFIAYIWYRRYSREIELSEEIPKVDVGKVWALVFGLFFLSMLVRIPFVLLYGEPYEKIVVIYLILMTMTWILHCKPSVFGFKFEGIGKALTVGAVYYAVLEFPAVIVQLVFVFFFVGEIFVAGYDFVPFLLSFPFATFCVGISEEGLFRGLMQTLLQKFYSAKVAIFVQSALFGLWHFIWHVSPLNFGEMAAHMLFSFIIGALFGYFYSIAGNLAPLILVHGLVDSFPFGYVLNQTAVDKLANSSIFSQFMVYVAPYILSITLVFILTRRLAEWMKKP